MRRGRTIVVCVVAAATLAVACSDEDGTADEPGGPGATTEPVAGPGTTVDAADEPEDEEPETADAPDATRWTVQPGPQQVAVLDADPGSQLRLEPADGGSAVADGVVDDAGSLLFRRVEPGEYRVTADGETTDAFRVPALDDPPPTALYDAQTLPAGGFGYLETRDGTTLSINVKLPGPAKEGPYPTVVEYSGYQPSDPAQGGLSDVLNALGFAHVGVNMRGSGCSGGSYEFFEPVQSLDGYDVIETVARQPWVKDQRVGMVGLSYPGISQLYVAATKPPSLAAITPLSVIDDAQRAIFHPGGLLNAGFGISWTQGLIDANAAEGQQWTADRIASGDEECADNQRLRGQNPDLPAQIREEAFWRDGFAGPLTPRELVERIDVPVFIAGAWQDEQTGARFATMLDEFTGSEHVYASLVNGLHTEAAAAGVFPRYAEFLDLYVAREVPDLAARRELNPVLVDGVLGADDVPDPDDRFAGMGYEEALAAFEAEPPVQVLFEEGAAEGAERGAPAPRFVESFDAWPPPAATARTWYLAPFAGLIDGPPDAFGGETRYTADPDALPATFYDPTAGSLLDYEVDWQWETPPAGTAASFLTAPLGEDTVVVGAGSADLWIRSSAPDTDLEVTISEVRRDGREMYVQSGWLRASQRALDDDASTELAPVHTFDEDDAEPLPDGEWELVRVELLPFAHAFRAGSQLRVTVDAPGNSRAIWVFETIADGETVEIAHDADHPSKLVLPVVPGIDVPDALPPCTLRGQPCRPFEPET